MAERESRGLVLREEAKMLGKDEFFGGEARGTLAHLGERTTEDRKVRGSSPRSPMLFLFPFSF